MMRRARTIKPEFFTSADVRTLPIPARMTFVGLLLYVDDYGNESADAALVKAAIWPTDTKVTVATVEQHMGLIADRGMVTFYEVDGRRYLRITNWEKHQRVDRPSRSNIPSDPARDWPVANEGGVGVGSGREGEPGEDEGDEEGAGVGRGRGDSRGTRASALEPPSPFCPDHPGGTTKACRACGNARLRLKEWENARDGVET